MNILAAGINHKTSPIDIREAFYLTPIERELVLSELKNDPRITGAFTLSTCNRIEIYATSIENDPCVLMDVLFKVKRIPPNPQLKNHFYTFVNSQAINHLLRVVTGLDSLIIGEKQILGQVKEAFEFSRKQAMMSRTLNILSNLVVETGKKARHETQIDFGGSSISWAAVMMAQDILGSLQDKTVLVLGSGKMGALAMQQLNNKGVKKIYVMNRTAEKAQELAEENGGTPVAIWEMKDILRMTDVCICSASCSHYLINKDLVEQIIINREDRKLLFIDISMPRNIDPEVRHLKNVRLVEVDDLSHVIENNIQKRLSAVLVVEGLIAKKIDEFYRAIGKVSNIEQMLNV